MMMSITSNCVNDGGAADHTLTKRCRSRYASVSLPCGVSARTQRVVCAHYLWGSSLTAHGTARDNGRADGRANQTVMLRVINDMRGSCSMRVRRQLAVSVI